LTARILNEAALREMVPTLDEAFALLMDRVHTSSVLVTVARFIGGAYPDGGLHVAGATRCPLVLNDDHLMVFDTLEADMIIAVGKPHPDDATPYTMSSAQLRASLDERFVDDDCVDSWRVFDALLAGTSIFQPS